MKKPNFFIIGAPKCGTTALSEYLKEHPNIYISPIKEPHYFADDFRAGNLPPGANPISNLNDYLALFEEAKKEHQAIGEASATYLSSEVAMPNIYQFNPQAKIIVMLRNPVDLVYAYHSQIVFNLGENESNFEQAWQLQTSRLQGKNIPPLCGNINVLQYRKVAQLGSQLDKLLTIFPLQQVKPIIFEYFKQNTAKVYSEVLNFLELPDFHKKHFPVINSNKSHKSAFIARLTQKPPKAIFLLTNTLKSLLKINSLGVANKLHQYNSQSQIRQPLTSQFRNQLLKEYEPEVRKLEQILQLNLAHWKQ